MGSATAMTLSPKAWPIRPVITNLIPSNNYALWAVNSHTCVATHHVFSSQEARFDKIQGWKAGNIGCLRLKLLIENIPDGSEYFAWTPIR